MERIIVPSMSYPPVTLYYLNQICDKYELSPIATTFENREWLRPKCLLSSNRGFHCSLCSLKLYVELIWNVMIWY